MGVKWPWSARMRAELSIAKGGRVVRAGRDVTLRDAVSAPGLLSSPVDGAQYPLNYWKQLPQGMSGVVIRERK